MGYPGLSRGARGLKWDPSTNGNKNKWDRDEQYGSHYSPRRIEYPMNEHIDNESDLMEMLIISV